MARYAEQGPVVEELVGGQPGGCGRKRLEQRERWSGCALRSLGDPRARLTLEEISEGNGIERPKRLGWPLAVGTDRQRPRQASSSHPSLAHWLRNATSSSAADAQVVWRLR